MDVRIILEILANGFLRYILDDESIENSLIHLEAPVVRGEDENSSRCKVHACRFDKLPVITLDIECIAPGAVRERRRIAEYEIISVVCLPEP